MSSVYAHIVPAKRKVLAILDDNLVNVYAKAHEFIVRDNGFIVPKYRMELSERIEKIEYTCKSVKSEIAPRFSFGIKKLVAPEDALWYAIREKCLPPDELLHAFKTFKAFAFEYNWAAYPHKLFRLWGCNVDAKQDIYSILLFSVYDNMYSAGGDPTPENAKYAPRRVAKHA